MTSIIDLNPTDFSANREAAINFAILLPHSCSVSVDSGALLYHRMLVSAGSSVLPRTPMLHSSLRLVPELEECGLQRRSVGG